MDKRKLNEYIIKFSDINRKRLELKNELHGILSGLLDDLEANIDEIEKIFTSMEKKVSEGENAYQMLRSQSNPDDYQVWGKLGVAAGRVGNLDDDGFMNMLYILFLMKKHM